MLNGTSLLCHHADTGVYRCFGFHSGSHYRRFCCQKGNCLTLHVGSHEGTVCIVIFQERDQGCCHREHHSRGHIHVVKHCLRIFGGLISVTPGYGISYEMSFLVQCLTCLCNMIIIFFICSHIDYFIGNPGVCRICLVDLTVRRLYKAILIDPCIGSKGVDQTDIRAFRCFNRAHSSIMGIMYVADLKSGTVSGKTTGAKCGQTPLMSQLTKRIVLIHKLGQLGRTKEFLHGCLYRLNVDQYLRRNLLCIMSSHSLADHSLQSGKTDTILVLQKLAYCTDTSVAQMIDIVVITDTVLKMHIIINGCQNIFLCNMLGHQFVNISLNGICKSFRIFAKLFNDLCKHRIINVLCNAKLLGITFYEMGNVYHHIGKNFDILFFCLNIYIRNCSILDLFTKLKGHLGSCCRKDLSCQGIYYILCKDLISQSVLKGKLFIKFISAYFSQIISSGVEEHCVNKAFRTFNAEGLTGTDFFVQL